jgi:hypothetical protein
MTVFVKDKGEVAAGPIRQAALVVRMKTRWALGEAFFGRSFSVGSLSCK